MVESNISKFKAWILAIRPKTLPAAVGPVLVGTGFAIHDNKFSPFPAVAAVIGAILLQIAANIANDYFDYLKGFDTEERIGPTRAAASGLLPINELKWGLIVVIGLSLIDGLYLIYVGGVPILIIGILSIIFAVLYSGGPFPLSSNGLGDIFVFIFFGLIAVSGTYYVQAISLTTSVIIGAVPVGLLITAILVVNNYRDIDTDRKVGKQTLAVLLGHKLTRYYYVGLLLISYLVPFYLLLNSAYNLFILLPVLSIPLGLKQAKVLFNEIDGERLNDALAGTAQLSLLYSILFFIGVIL